MRIFAVVTRIEIGVAAGEKQAVEVLHNLGDIFGFWDKRYVDGHTAGRFHRFAVIAAEIESPRRQLKPHCDTDLRASCHKPFYVQSIAQRMSIWALAMKTLSSALY